MSINFEFKWPLAEKRTVTVVCEDDGFVCRLGFEFGVYEQTPTDLKRVIADMNEIEEHAATVAKEKWAEERADMIRGGGFRRYA